MAERRPSFIQETLQIAVGSVRGGWQVLLRRGPSQVQFWFIALFIGIGAGFAALNLTGAALASLSLSGGSGTSALTSHSKTPPAISNRCSVSSRI